MKHSPFDAETLALGAVTSALGAPALALGVEFLAILAIIVFL